MTIEIKMLTLGIAATNCYIVGDTTSGEALVIDPVDQAPLLVRTAQDAGWSIRRILATHGHFDHVLASKELKALTNAPFTIHQADIPFLESLPQQGLMFVGHAFPEAAAVDQILTNASETITVGGITLETIYTPGHSPGHVSYLFREAGLVFSGDCLFTGSVGRTDLPGGNHVLLMRTIFDKLLPLGDNVRVLPGHMEPTTLGKERATNPFLLDYGGRTGE